MFQRSGEVAAQARLALVFVCFGLASCSSDVQSQFSSAPDGSVGTGGAATGGAGTGGGGIGGSGTGGTGTGGTGVGGTGNGGTGNPPDAGDTSDAGSGGSGSLPDGSASEDAGSGGDVGAGGAGAGGTGAGGADTGGAGGVGAGGAGTGGVGAGGAGTGGNGSGMTTSQQIQDVLDASAGSGLTLPIDGAYVTYTRPAAGSEPSGFFLQAEASGPAIFVALPLSSTNPPLAVGDRVNLLVTATSTLAGLPEVTAATGLTVVASNHAIEPLVANVTTATDLVSSLASYQSRVISFTGTIGGPFTSAGGGTQVAANLVTTGVTGSNLRIRMPETVRAAFDLEAGCTVTVDYGVMWRFNAVAEPSAFSASDFTNVACPVPTVVGATAPDGTHVVVTFDRTLDAATVQSGDFTFDNGLQATAVSVSGKTVTVTTTAQSAATYTVSVKNVNDVLGAAIGMPSSAMFGGSPSKAQLLIDELNPNIAGAHDLVELLVTSGGSVSGYTLIEDGATLTTLATLPDVTVATGDLVVVHLNPASATGAAPASETTAKNQYANATYSANYDGAWDFQGDTFGLANSDRILRLEAPGNVVIDAVPVVLSTSASPPSAFPADLQTLQAAGGWLPADCGGSLCTYTSTPTAVAISVDYVGAGTTATGNSIARKSGMNTKTKADWNAAAAQSFGAANP
ncbi:MAG TPA: Ig-like domain-containing protein [Polyangiaceae bacterium]|nr:Ig-like domain-containing protein [Polyangiaceae bacterium]